MNSEIESTAMREAISPAAWPPIPSATRKSFASSATRNVSSLCCRCRPTWVSPTALRSILTSALLEKGKPLSALLALSELSERGLHLQIIRVPFEGLIEISLRLGREAGALADQPRILQINRIDRLALDRRLDGLHGLAGARRDADRGEGQVVEPFAVVGVMLNRHVEVLVRRAHVAFFERLDALR